eukprot:174079_1
MNGKQNYGTQIERERRKVYTGPVRCYCWFDYVCHIVFNWSRSTTKHGILHEISHIVSDYVTEEDDAHGQVYLDIKLMVCIINDLDVLMQEWKKCNLGEVDREYVGNLCGKIGTIKEIDTDSSCHIYFMNYNCYIPSQCCTILEFITDESVMENWSFD